MWDNWGMDPSHTLQMLDAKAYGLFAPMFLAIGLLLFRHLTGRWMRGYATLAVALGPTVSGILWMLATTPAKVSMVAASYTVGAIFGSMGFVVILGIGLALDRLSRAVAERPKRLTRRGTL
jgi:hypothetical protein